MKLADVHEGAVLRDEQGCEWRVVRRWGQRIGGWGDGGRWIEGADVALVDGAGRREVDDLDVSGWEVVP